MDKKLYLSILVLVPFIFIAWFLVSYFGRFPYDFPEKRALAIPFVWACLFIYLHGKKHTYIAINSYIIFLLLLFADRLNFDSIPPNVHISYLLLSIFSVFLFISIYQNLLPQNSRYASIFCFSTTLIFYAIPFFYIIYAINFNADISREVFYAILQTDLNEAIEYLQDNLSSLWFGIVFLAAFLIGYLLLKQERIEGVLIEKSLLIFLVAVFGVLSYSNKAHVRLYSFAKYSIADYWREMASFRYTQKQLRNSSVSFEATKSEKGETYLVVIGESLNKKNMGLYGYFRDTTPLLSEQQRSGNLLLFDNAYSVHIQTMETLSQALTEANQNNRKTYFNSPSVVSVLNRAGFETHWVTNQVLAGKWDNLVSVIAHQTNHLTAFNRTIGERVESQEFDAVVIGSVNEILQKETARNRVIFVHLMGNHGDYCSRYPENYNIFSGKLDEAEFGKIMLNAKWQEKLNCYDNSVAYNDFVVSSLLSLIKRKRDVSGFLYFSDHGEDAVGGLLHNQSSFTFEMTQIPLLMWLSDGYKTRYKDKYSSLLRNNDALFPNDRIYDTLIGMLNVYTENYNVINDLSSSAYYMREEGARTLHRKIEYSSSSNYYFHQGKNITRLQETGQLQRVVPYRVNSIGKLKDVLFDGYKSFEVDVHYGHDGSNHFVVGHNSDVMSGMSFEQFITIFPHSKIERVLLDFKNLEKENYNEALKKLNRLDAKYNLKDKLIVESTTMDRYYNKYQKAGWHTSFKLPTDQILKLLEDNKINELRDLAKNIYKQSSLQKISSISFDSKLYPFVKRYLEPLISENIEYLVRDSSLRMFSKDLYSELNKKDFYIDNRVTTILLSYESRFNL